VLRSSRSVALDRRLRVEAPPEVQASIREICQAAARAPGYLFVMKPFLVLTAALLLCAASCKGTGGAQASPDPRPRQGQAMELGAFSISLAVKDIEASRAFYEKLGFEPAGIGDAAQGWLILRNGDVTIGLFQGMFERNILTFNPGWTSEAQPLATFTDVRELQRMAKERGLVPVTEADESTSGPASFVLVDPDGNPVLIDQHVARP
jgi:catechol 2,3-dioxygenase-like lactoylglutathione lyase family enzyme